MLRLGKQAQPCALWQEASKTKQDQTIFLFCVFRLHQSLGKGQRGPKRKESLSQAKRPLQRDRQQRSCDRHPSVPRRIPRGNLKCDIPFRAEKIGATGPFSGGVARFSCDTPPNPGKHSATERSATGLLQRLGYL